MKEENFSTFLNSLKGFKSDESSEKYNLNSDVKFKSPQEVLQFQIEVNQKYRDSLKMIYFKLPRTQRKIAQEIFKKVDRNTKELRLSIDVLDGNLFSKMVYIFHLMKNGTLKTR